MAIPAPEPRRREEETKLTAQELKDIKKHLSVTRDEITRRLQEKKLLDMPQAEVGDPIDQASQSLDKEVLFEVTDKDQLMLEQIESALRRIEKGVYGTCESCRCVIPKKRLQALPFARYCVNCQTSNEASIVSTLAIE
jgi:DnaK suppressor protein